jgi:hypothetical protein
MGGVLTFFYLPAVRRFRFRFKRGKGFRRWHWHRHCVHKVALQINFKTILKMTPVQTTEGLQVGQPFDLASLKLVDVTATAAAQATDATAPEVYIEDATFSNVVAESSDVNIFTAVVDGTDATKVDDAPVGAGTATLTITATVTWTDPATKTTQSGSLTATAQVVVQAAAEQPVPDQVALEIQFGSVSGTLTPATAPADDSTAPSAPAPTGLESGTAAHTTQAING